MSQTEGTSAALNADAATHPPNWAEFKEEVHCPLCDYNLRGLNEPRCPECGHRFTWHEVFDQLTAHPYLFEHQPRRNVWSFFKTFGRDCRPNTFWREITPSHPIKMGRLLRFWLIANSVLLVLLVLPLIRTAVLTARDNVAMRSVMITVVPSITVFSPPSAPRTWSPPKMNRSAYINANWPVPWTKPFFLQVWRQFHWHQSESGAVLLILAWPWLTYPALLIFRISMRRARINTAHVVRCAVYSCDFALLMVAALLAWTIYEPRSGSIVVLLAMALCSTVTLYRLTIAYKRYMRLDHPFSTALASQVIVLLAVIDFALNA